MLASLPSSYRNRTELRGELSRWYMTSVASVVSNNPAESWIEIAVEGRHHIQSFYSLFRQGGAVRK